MNPLSRIVGCQLLVILIVLLSSCMSSGPSRLESGLLDRKHAIEIANWEILRRNLSLPRNHTIRVAEAQMFDEVNGVVPVYEVYFDFIQSGRSTNLYNITVNRRSGEIEFFSDSRKGTPGSVYSKARRAP